MGFAMNIERATGKLWGWARWVKVMVKISHSAS